MKKRTTIILVAACMTGETAVAREPYDRLEGSYISLQGKVAAATPESFELNYGEGIITVEMDHWEWYPDAYASFEDNDVTVHGYVDEGFYDGKTIIASSIYIDQIGTYFYPSGIDEMSAAAIAGPPGDFDLKITGKVTSVRKGELTIDSGDRKLTVDTGQLEFNTLDDQGFRRIDIGDRVAVFGDLNQDLFEEREICAEALIKLQEG